MALIIFDKNTISLSNIKKNDLQGFSGQKEYPLPNKEITQKEKKSKK